jgi:hypothetical protein
MRRFYQLLRKSETASFDPTRANPLLAEERGLLVRSYAALLAAVHR